MNNQKVYVLRDAEAGNEIERFTTLEEAEEVLAIYEADDKKDGMYQEGFYEIDEQEADDEDEAYIDRVTSPEYAQFLSM